MPFIRKNPLNYPANNENPIRIFEDNRAPTNADFRQFMIGDEWWDTSTFNFWKMAYKDTTQGIWRLMSGGVGVATLLTPDVGGQVPPDVFNNINLLGDGVNILTTGNPGANTITISLIGGGPTVNSITTDDTNVVLPAAGNINYLGDTGIYNNGIYFFGDVANNTVSARDLRNITVYVVDPTPLETEYQTIQAALDQAFADLGVDGSATIYVRPGVYVENLTFYQMYIDLVGAIAIPNGGTATIIGTHAPANSDSLSIRNIAFQSDTNILNSAAAGATTIALIDCTINAINGFTFNLPSWTGTIAFLHSYCFGTDDGFINNSLGGASIVAIDSICGSGSNNIGTIANFSQIINCEVFCPIDFIGQSYNQIRNTETYNILYNSDASLTFITDSYLYSTNDEVIQHTSSSVLYLNHVTIDSIHDPAIVGTGSIEFGSVIFLYSATLDPLLIELAAQYQRGGPIEVSSADGSDVTEDAWIKYVIPGVMGYSMGIDNSTAADDFKLTDGIDPSNGNEILKVDGGSYAITFNNAYTFPTTDGLANQVLSTDGAGTVTWASAVTNQVVIQTFTAGGNYVPTVGMQYCIIEVLGAGGAGGGCLATPAGNYSASNGGSAGEYARGVYSAAVIGAFQVVTIGSGGVGVAGATGGNGGNSSVGALISASGGLGGRISAIYPLAGGAYTIWGSPGGTGGAGGSFRTPGAPSATIGPDECLYMGVGANTQYGAGGLTVGFNINGSAGLGYGSGGGGCANLASQPARTGGNGAAGIVIITEYI